MRNWVFGEHADPSSSDAARAEWLARYDAHNAAVLRYFSDHPERLLAMNIAEGDGWEQLCRFLDRPFAESRSRSRTSIGLARDSRRDNWAVGLLSLRFGMHASRQPVRE